MTNPSAANNFQRALIIKLRHHGDVLLSTPLISALAKSYPGIEIDALIYAETLDMLRDNQQLKHCLSVKRRREHNHLGEQIKHEANLLFSLKARNYDLLIHLTESWRGAALARILNPTRSIAFAYPRRNNFLWRSSFSDLVSLPIDNSVHNVEMQLSSLSALDLYLQSSEFKLRFEVNQPAQKRVIQLLTESGWKKQPFVLIHPGSRWMFKCWEDERFAELINALSQRGISVVLSAAPDAQEMLMIKNIWQKITNTKQVYSLAGKLSLAELGATINMAQLFVGVDSVPMHLSAALQIPSIALFGPSKINEWRPWQSDSTLINAANWGELPHPDSIDTKTTQRYLQAIPSDAVINAVLSKLEQ